jgi:outer membrane protein assembly factor BamE (lipoprotein component of BamABCDE complex)
MRALFLLGILLLGLAPVSGCATYDRRAGVANLWRADSLPEIRNGATTQAEVLDLLGPPSQVIALDDRVVYYYLRERTHGRIQLFLVYNRQAENISYDRAIFFFDPEGLLMEHAFSRERIPLE